MSFELKYDANGEVIQSAEPAENTAPATQEQPVSNSDNALADLAAPEEAAPQAPVEEPKRKPTPQESWKIVRERAEAAERRAEEAERLLQQYTRTANQSAPESNEDLDLSVDEDSLVEGKHLSKVAKKIKHLEQQLRSYEQQSVVASTELKLKAQYPDFDNIVSGENLANLRAAYPEIAATINSSNDLYSKAVTAYTMIKRLGIADVPGYEESKEVARRNASKPKPLASISPQQGDSPLSKANAFANGKMSDDLQKQLWKEMNDARKSY